jgi:uncharacterized protein YlbG (UPF0298 family)
VETGDRETLQQRQTALSAVKNVRPLHTYGDGIHENRRFCLFDVPVKDLDKTVADLSEVKDVKVEFIHNF